MEAKRLEENKFDINRIETALLDKRAPQRQVVTGSMVNPTASLGSSTANAPQLSQNELGALKAALIAQLKRCWNPPVGVVDAKDLSVVLQFSLNRDGSLSSQPTLANRASSPLFQVAVESAKRAVLGCQPFRLPVAKYEAWQDLEVTFNSETFGG